MRVRAWLVAAWLWAGGLTAAFAADRVWSAASASWFGEANWAPVGAPAPSENATVTNNGTSVVDADGSNAVANVLTLGGAGGTGRLVVNAGTVTVSAIAMGNNATLGHIIQSNGTVIAGTMTMGVGASSCRVEEGSSRSRTT